MKDRTESTRADEGIAAGQLAAEIKSQGQRLGFDLVGIAPAGVSRYREYLRQWLDDGQAGSMHYLNRRFDERTDPSAYLPGAKSVICVGVNYHVPLEEPGEDEKEHHGRVARYALGEDYHEWIKLRLHALADWLRQRVPEAQTRAAVDTAPVMEKELAQRAGVGWIGKNTCLIHPRIGSWLLLGEVITSVALPADEPGVDRCGTCRRCIEACPTRAITEPYRLDARKCISYLTIEHGEEIPAALRQSIGDWLYGCDVCQEVCPWNGRAPVADQAGFRPRFATGTIDLRQVEAWDEEAYRDHLRGSAMKRVKLPVLRRNARIVRENINPRGGGCPEGR